ncbi:hypothetical protein QBC33DRAFT_444098 [Phialemonium atrogriseum]|uniref:Nephrocystin 3-like N-terminal domain-containing protein n=1 Tax=Phialemonium atrogriseum TaxID=1093897 RepID=A0AAJ0CBS5_9PEZI|nr:uncharacterized protein QBC33DRAFT_444098 [Phialemonium atrogriseum]KAK1771351.1 hypothetical protein QBC33DRAFT_444098 [Phialemonium atrogriseum]
MRSEDDNVEASEPQHKYRRLNPFSTAHQGKDSAHSAVYWPRDLLPTTVPNAQVLTYGYDTNIRHWAGQPVSHNTVRDIAWDFLVALEAIRRAKPTRPLLFVVHSLGGIIVKELLRRSSGLCQGQKRLRAVFESTIGIMFFGTPHGGADPRRFLQHAAEMVVKAIGYTANEQIVKTLLPSSERLRELRDEFVPLAQEQQWVIHSFQEELGIMALGSRKVVEDTSSYLNIPTVETTEHIRRNHMAMCRFSGPDDAEYKKVAAALRRMTTNLPENRVPNPGASLTMEQRQQLRDSLKFDQIDARHMSIKIAHAKTCKWLKKKDEYLDWLNPSKFPEHHGFLWVRGNPGTGKSTLMKFALAQARRTMKERIILSFFFNARGGALEKSTVGMYRSLLLQLLDSIPALDAMFDSLCLIAWPRDGHMQWSVELLKDLFEQAVQSLGQSQVICFIDALDECDEDQIRDMLSFFEHIGELAVVSNTRFQVCISSRHYPYITIARGLGLVLEGQEGHRQDITNYIDTELKIGHSKAAEEIRAELQTKATGIFMWVVLVVDILNKEHDRGRIHTLRKRLREIPAGLHDLFRDILTRDTRDKDELILCIQWVLFAKKPLRPEELYYAVLAGTEPDSLEPWDQKLTTLDTIRRFILDSSKGLAETTKSKTPVVQFIHESVRDFLLKDNGLQEIWPDPGGRFQGPSHERLKECCLKYISTDIAKSLHLPEPLPVASSEDAASLRDLAQQSYPFLEYAVHSILHHADEAESEDIVQLDFLQSFPLQSWINMHNLLERYQARRLTSEASLLYILAERNLARLIQAHFSTSSPLEASKERYENPFFAALATESTDATQALAKLELCKSTGLLTSFQRLCQSYLEDSNQIPKLSRNSLLLKKPIELAKQGKVELTRLLLATGKVEVNTRDHRGQTLLSQAAENGHEAVVKLLLATGKVDVNAKDNLGQTLLSQAAENGHKAVAELLLATGKVDVNAKDDPGWTPLSWAARNGHKAVDVDAKDNLGQTPLSQAARNGREAIAELLLATGKVDVNAKDDSGWTPLSWAARNGHKAVAELLLATGKVDVDAKDNLGQTPLSQAARNGREAIVELLLATGKVDVNAKDDSGWTPLSQAARNGREAIAKLLLATGKVDVNAKDNSWQTPLLQAARNGHEAIAELLLATGKVDVDAKDNFGQTPLSWAARNGHEAIAELLLATGKVDVNAKDDLGCRFHGLLGIGTRL